MAPIQSTTSGGNVSQQLGFRNPNHRVDKVYLVPCDGIGDGLVRLCAGIEAMEDIIGDLDQALDWSA